MNVLDETIMDSQFQLLRSWSIKAHRIGHEIGSLGMKDEDIIPLLHQLRSAAFSLVIWAFTSVIFVILITV